MVMHQSSRTVSFLSIWKESGHQDTGWNVRPNVANQDWKILKGCRAAGNKLWPYDRHMTCLFGRFSCFLLLGLGWDWDAMDLIFESVLNMKNLQNDLWCFLHVKQQLRIDNPTSFSLAWSSTHACCSVYWFRPQVLFKKPRFASSFS